MEDNGNVLIDITKASKRLGVTRQAVYLAIKNKKLKSRKVEHKHYVSIKDLKEFSSQKYVRRSEAHNGIMNINESAKYLGVKEQKIYYWCRHGVIDTVKLPNSKTIYIEEKELKKFKSLRRNVNRDLKK